MATDFHSSTEQSATSLVSGIVEDFQNLVKQQLKLTRVEILEDLRKAKEAALMFIVGIGVTALGGFASLFALAHLLHWATGPSGMDPASLPLWACYGIISVIFLGAGAFCAWMGSGALQSIRPLDNPASEALKQNVEWATNQTDAHGNRR